jgi:DNA-binding response OmpR family regulator
VAARKRLLYVDADAEARLLMHDLLAPHDVDLAVTAAEARGLARRHSHDLFVIAGGGPDCFALALCQCLQRVDGRTPILFCSSNGSRRFQEAAIAAGAVRYLVKPLEPALLRSTIALLLKLAELESARAMVLEQKAISDELLLQSTRARAAAAAAHDKAQQAIERMVRAKAYRAFREGGGNRANFERMWPLALEEAQSSGA